MKNLIFMYLVALLAASVSATVSGRVVDTAGNPVFDAMINYTDIKNRLVYVYTNKKGEFRIPSPTEWSLENLPMYASQTTSIREKNNPRIPSADLSLFSLRLSEGKIFFNLTTAGKHHIVAKLFDLSGKKIAQVFDQNLSAGCYSFAPFCESRTLSDGVYILSLSDGTSQESIKVIKKSSFNSVPLVGVRDAKKVTGIFKTTEAIDGLRAGKTGYKSNTINLNNYNEDVGDIKISLIDIEGKVDSIVNSMTTDEKIGQMLQSGNGAGVANLYVGSTLKGSTWDWMQTIQNQAMQTSKKVPLTIGSDWVHGGPTIYFPHNIGLGAMNDSLLVELCYRVIAMCAKPGNNVDFAPCLDIPRDDRYGRVYEGWSENVDDVISLARASVRGLQGTDLSSDYTMIATAKHYAGAGGTWDGDMRGETKGATWKQLCRIHLPQFHAAVDAGVGSIMTAYNSYLTSASNNAQTSATSNKALITDTLKNGWGFDGFVISDWMQVYNPGANIDRVADGFTAGLDVAMQPDLLDGLVAKIKSLVSTKTISMDRVNDAAKRHIRVKLRMGLFNNPMSKKELDNFTSAPEYRNVARACVRKSIVLLKNNSKVLPLKKTAKIHLVGSWADNIGNMCGGWTFSGGDPWQGANIPHGIPGATTIKEAFDAAIGPAGKVTYATTATAIPSDADVIVVVVGETPYAEGEGYRKDISLSTDHITLVQDCAASGKPVVTILITGRPNTLGSIPDKSTALVAAWLPGTEGKGVTDVLFGDFNFTGTLKFQWPKTTDQEPINYGDFGDRVGIGGLPLFTYGTGLRY